ncbi:MAG: hypothetical protein M4579_003906 [Chaenotheca gracillima]|nr:MAG: hypothetical protein M4579_003906 [Chaenotheca gracillima]
MITTFDDAATERSSSQRTTTSRASSSKKKIRPSLSKNEEFVVTIDLPSFGRKKKKKHQDRYEAEDADVIVVPEAGRGHGASYDNRPPVPPPAPMPPNYGFYHPDNVPQVTGYDSNTFQYPPPQYRDEWQPREPPLIIQVSPPASPRRIAAGSAQNQRARRQSPRAESRQAGDQYLREGVQETRRAQRRAEEERERVTEERLQTAQLHRRANANIDRRERPREHDLPIRERADDEIRRRNLAAETSAMARDQDRQSTRRAHDAVRQEIVLEQEAAARTPAERVRRTRAALLAGERVAHSVPRRPSPAIHHYPVDDGGYRSSSEDSYHSVPSDTTRIYTMNHAQRGSSARERGQRVLEAAAARWREGGADSGTRVVERAGSGERRDDDEGRYVRHVRYRYDAQGRRIG